MRAIAWWPGRIKAGKTTADLSMAMDVMPTLAKLAGVKIPDGLKLDGRDLSGLILATNGWLEREVYWQHGKAQTMRDGQWKLVVNQRGQKEKVGLYNLAKDRKESDNLAAYEIKRTTAMMKKLKAWEKDVAAKQTKDVTPSP